MSDNIPRHIGPARKVKYHRQVFAHLRSLDCACPACGEVYLGEPYLRKPGERHRTRIMHKRQRMGEIRGYDPTTGRFRCARCNRMYVLGVIFWPLAPKLGQGRPGDTIPTLEEAIALRECASRRAEEARAQVRDPANVVEPEPLPDPEILSPFAKDDPLT